jgi:hypothetical protein
VGASAPTMHYVAPSLQVSKLAGGRGQSSTTSGPSPPAVLPPLLLSWLFPRAATKPPSAGPLRRPAVSTTSSSAHVVYPMPSTPGRCVARLCRPRRALSTSSTPCRLHRAGPDAAGSSSRADDACRHRPAGLDGPHRHSLRRVFFGP